MLFCFFFKQKTAYEMRISDWSSDVCSSDLWATPAGFVPAQDQGYALAAIQLPPGSSIQQTDAVLKKVVKKLLDVPGTEAAVMFAGFDGASGTQASNAGAAYVTFKPFAARAGTDRPDRNIKDQMPAAIAPVDRKEKN